MAPSLPPPQQQGAGRRPAPPQHPATVRAHEAVRTAAEAFAEVIADYVPAGRHRAMAITSVQEAMWAANAAIACDTPREDG